MDCPVDKCISKLTLSSFKNHIEESHSTMLIDSWECFICLENYKSYSTLFDHINNHHKETIDEICKSTPIQILGDIRKTNFANNAKKRPSNDSLSCAESSSTQSSKKIKQLQSNEAMISTDVENFERIEAEIKKLVGFLFGHSKISGLLAADINQRIESFITIVLNEVSKLSTSLPKINILSAVIQSKFLQFSTNYRVNKEFGNKNAIQPYTKTIHSTLGPRRKNGKRVLGSHKITSQVYPLRMILKNFLSIPNILNDILSHMDKCEQSDKIISPMQGSRWKKTKSHFGNKIVFPLALYCDDFEINNPLSSHRGVHKIGGVYFSLLCVPNKYRSVLSNIFVAQIHNTKDHAMYGNYRLFSEIISELEYLEKTGITISVDGHEQHIYFVLHSFLGDNLAQNTILGFVASFNAICCCRFCTATLEQRKNQEVVERKLLRKKNIYIVDPKNQGVKEICMFNQLEHYDVLDNMSADKFHDVDLGIARYVMGKIIKKLVYQYQCFDIDDLNERIKMLKCETSKGTNIIPHIKEIHIKKEHLIITGSEMKTLVKYFGFYVGFYVPETTPEWQLYIKLRKLMACLRSSSFDEKKISNLNNLIQDHHALYKELFDDLKYKFHNIVHYPDLIREMGPLIFYDTARFESKHQSLKEITSSTKSRINPPLTIARKYTVQLLQEFQAQKQFSARLIWGPLIQENLTQSNNYSIYEQFMLPDEAENTFLTKWVNIYGTHYERELCIDLKEEDQMDIAEIVDIGINKKNSKITFFYRSIEIIQISDHLQGSVIKKTDTWGSISQEKLCVYKPRMIMKLTDNQEYIAHTF